jgi:hypothetical protein
MSKDIPLCSKVQLEIGLEKCCQSFPRLQDPSPFAFVSGHPIGKILESPIIKMTKLVF